LEELEELEEQGGMAEAAEAGEELVALQFRVVGREAQEAPASL
jgi:hypothetical protein